MALLTMGFAAFMTATQINTAMITDPSQREDLFASSLFILLPSLQGNLCSLKEALQYSLLDTLMGKEQPFCTMGGL